MKANPLVSVIVPTYKRPQQCLRAVRSILLQSFDDFEVIVGDDYGADETEKLLADLDDSRIRYFKNGQDGGSASKNRNLCITRSRGSYLTFLDSDDFILPTKLELQVAALNAADSCVGFAMAGTRVVKVSNGSYYRYKDLVPSAEGDIREAYFGRKLSCYNTSMMVRRDALEEVGLWDPVVGPYDDSELIMRLLLKYKAVRVQEVTTLWFDLEGGDSFSSDQEARRSGLEAFLLKHATLMPLYPEWADFRIKELSKMMFVAGEHKNFRKWITRTQGRSDKVLQLMRLLSYIPSYRAFVKAFGRLLSCNRQPSWMSHGPVVLEELVPEQYLPAIKSIL